MAWVVSLIAFVTHSAGSSDGIATPTVALIIAWGRLQKRVHERILMGDLIKIHAISRSMGGAGRRTYCPGCFSHTADLASRPGCLGRGDTRVSLLVLGFASSITAEQIGVVSVHTTRLQFHLALDLKRV
jgi:hypothetical protein